MGQTVSRCCCLPAGFDEPKTESLVDTRYNFQAQPQTPPPVVGIVLADENSLNLLTTQREDDQVVEKKDTNDNGNNNNNKNDVSQMMNDEELRDQSTTSGSATATAAGGSSSFSQSLSDSFGQTMAAAASASAHRKLLPSAFRGLRQEGLDTIVYRRDPGETSENDPDLCDNVNFYHNKIKSRPYGDTIEQILEKWRGNYRELESNHGYIQWLFPIRTQGMNSYSHPLQLHELQVMRSSAVVRRRLESAFDMMLDFYGMKLKRSGAPSATKFARTNDYKAQYANLINRTHNNLRISRILKCLGDFEMSALQIGWLEFLVDEIFVSKELGTLATSMANYWVHTVKDDRVREALIDQIESLLVQENNDDNGYNVSY